jgi:tRNA(adenine34) deaminase
MPLPDDRAEALMQVALDQARAASAHGDVPVGAVVARLSDGAVLAARHNERELTRDPTAHAELLALRDASAALGGWRLDGCVLVVTLEPCAMCAGAIVNARVPTLVYGATDPKAGAVASLYEITTDPRLNHRVEVHAGLRADECGALLKDFFAARRGGSGAETPKPAR